MEDFRESVARICKMKLSPRKSSIECFVFQVLLVGLGLRETYLVDCFSLPASVIVKLLVQCPKFVHDRVFLITLPTQDIFIVNRDIFMAKCNADSQRCHIIDISSTIPVLITDDARRNRILAALHTACNRLCTQCSSRDVPILEAEIDTEIVGYDFFAGWMLGYPFMYYYIPSGDGTNALSMEPLTQVSFTVSSATNHQYDLRTFTVPSRIVSSDTITAYVNEKLEEYDALRRQYCSIIGGVSVEVRDMAHASISL